MRKRASEYRATDASNFQGYLSRLVNIDSLGGTYAVFPIHVDTTYLYCVDANSFTVMRIPYNQINTVSCR
ncbi:hypothetical protein [Bacillus sp. CECT 9360]|uniref:hypothetical protein n=1 Tax=Bacillus sp. CECT 9360 TaxID=2845821 RepID=UPI001E29EDEB|nr:hypothetical protein [Bacillus sp. CECT 9360]CAH0345152.1 hypothetical protein BCI9360_01431 [Bacillus sp. CECT 9360]